MKTSSPQQPKPPQNKAILLIGPPGSRKTTLGMQFPGLYIIDCDQNLDGPDSINRKARPELHYSYDQLEDDGKLLDPAECYDRVIMLLQKVRSEDEIKWVMLDGLTSCNEYIIRKVMKEQKCSYLEARHWSTFKTDAINLLFTKMRHLNKNVIVTAHEVENAKNDPKNVMSQILLGYEPFVQGAVREMLGGFFTDVWRIEALPAVAGKVETILYTDKIPLMKQLKNSMCLPAEIKEPTYEKLSKLSGGVI